jgi:hypothetical protein
MGNKTTFAKQRHDSRFALQYCRIPGETMEQEAAGDGCLPGITLVFKNLECVYSLVAVITVTNSLFFQNGKYS